MRIVKFTIHMPKQIVIPIPIPSLDSVLLVLSAVAITGGALGIFGLGYYCGCINTDKKYVSHVIKQHPDGWTSPSAATTEDKIDPLTQDFLNDDVYFAGNNGPQQALEYIDKCGLTIAEIDKEGKKLSDIEVAEERANDALPEDEKKGVGDNFADEHVYSAHTRLLYCITRFECDTFEHLSQPNDDSFDYLTWYHQEVARTLRMRNMFFDWANTVAKLYGEGDKTEAKRIFKSKINDMNEYYGYFNMCDPAAEACFGYLQKLLGKDEFNIPGLYFEESRAGKSEPEHYTEDMTKAQITAENRRLHKAYAQHKVFPEVTHLLNLLGLTEDDKRLQ